MLKYIIEVYFLRKVSSAVIRLQRSPPYTGCLPRNDHLLRRFSSVHRTASHEPPLSYNSHPLTMTHCWFSLGQNVFHMFFRSTFYEKSLLQSSAYNGHLRTPAAFLEMTTSSEGSPLYTGQLPMNRLFLTTATPSQ